MSLTITPEMIRELLDRAEASGRADETGIILTAGGWEVAVRPNGLDGGLTALSADGVYSYLDGYDLDDDAAEALCVPDEPGTTTYAIPDEDGDYTTPDDGIKWAVVTHIRDEDDDDVPSWTDAWWFDVTELQDVLDEETTGGRTRQLYRTRSGRYLERIDSQWMNDPGVHWVEISLAEAVRQVYGADEDRVATDTLVAVQVARHARTLVDLLTPSHDAGLDEAAEIFHTAKAVSELLRRFVSPDVRSRRATAGRIVVHRHFDGNQTRAAEHLGLHVATLSNLLKD